MMFELYRNGVATGLVCKINDLHAFCGWRGVVWQRKISFRRDVYLWILC
jgi:hypothetical protein